MTPQLRTPRHQVSKKSVVLWTMQAAVFWLVLFVPQAIVFLLVGEPPVWELALLVATGVVGLVHTAVEPSWRYRVHRWETTPEAVYTLSGWLNQEWRVAPVSRIQTIDTKRGPFQQILGLSTVTVTTASAAGPVEIEGLDHEVAQQLVVELTNTTQATPGDAT
ncbi:PH domain-containing protein [Lentzea sp. NPDC060358]|uniref:PH domain-containing protein n=1 Tax=Lentzea sp. NPDC060358 TaxID=3347103 RepID=UPI00366913FB